MRKINQLFKKFGLPYKSLLCLVFCAVVLSGKSLAGYSINYYVKVFERWGFDSTYIIPKDAAVTAVTISLNEFPPFVTSKRDAEKIVILASQVNQLTGAAVPTNSGLGSLSNYRTVFLICDVPLSRQYEQIFGLSCGTANVMSAKSGGFAQTLNFYISHESTNPYFIIYKKFGPTGVYVIPETYLVSTVFSDRLGSLVTAFSKSASTNNLNYSALETSASAALLPKEFVALEVVFYGLLAIFVLFVFDGTVRYYINRKQRGAEGTVSAHDGSVGRLVSTFKPLIQASFIVMVILQITLFILYFSKPEVRFGADTLGMYLTRAFIYAGTDVSTDPVFFIRFAYFAFNWFFVLSALILLIPALIKLIKTAFANVPKFVVGADQAMVTAVVVGFLWLLLVFVFNTGPYNATFFILSAIVFGLITLVKTHKLSLASTPVSARKRNSVVMFIVFYVFLGFAVSLYIKRNSSSVYAYKSLISTSDKIVELPYTKEGGNYVRFKDFYVQKTNEIFVGNHLITEPGYDYISNRIISELRQDQLPENYMIVNTSRNSIAQSLLHIPEFRNFATTKLATAASDFIYIDNFRFRSETEYYVSISYKCVLDSKEFLYVMNLATPQKIYTSDGTLFNGRIDFMNFPGCVAGQKGSFLLPLTLSQIPDGSLVMYLSAKKHDSTSSAISTNLVSAGVESSFALFDGGNLVKSTGISVPEAAPLLYKNLTTPSTKKITSYYFTDSKNVPDFNIDPTMYKIRTRPSDNLEDLSSKVNLSAFINRMMNAGYINNPVLIWSSYPKVVIKNDYVGL
jgi:hypothetical protein